MDTKNQLALVVIASLIGYGISLVIAYLLIKAAVRNGYLEARDIIDLERRQQRRPQ